MAFLRYSPLWGSNELINIGCCRDAERSRRQGRGKTAGSLQREGRKWESLLVSTPHPPSPTALKAATGAGFTKCACKILSPKGLEVKILKTRHLARPLRVYPRLRRCL